MCYNTCKWGGFMDYGKCFVCKKIIQFDKINICDNCIQNEIKKIRDFINEHGKKPIDDIHENTGVSKKLLFYLYNEGLLYSDEEYSKESREELLKRKKLLLIHELNNSIKEENKKTKVERSGARMYTYKKN